MRCCDVFTSNAVILDLHLTERLLYFFLHLCQSFKTCGSVVQLPQKDGNMLSRLSMTIASAVSSHSYPSTKKLFSSITHSSILTTSTNRLLNLNDMGPIPGAFKKVQVDRNVDSYCSRLQHCILSASLQEHSAHCKFFKLLF